jgi:hypothetical protein
MRAGIVGAGIGVLAAAMAPRRIGVETSVMASATVIDRILSQTPAGLLIARRSDPNSPCLISGGRTTSR